MKMWGGFSLVIQFNDSLELEVSPVNQMKEWIKHSGGVTIIQEVSFPGHNHYDSYFENI